MHSTTVRNLKIPKYSRRLQYYSTLTSTVLYIFNFKHCYCSLLRNLALLRNIMMHGVVYAVYGKYISSQLTCQFVWLVSETCSAEI